MQHTLISRLARPSSLLVLALLIAGCAGERAVAPDVRGV